MFEFAGDWEKPINYLFLAVTGFIAWHGIRYRTDIAATFFFLVLFQDVLGVVSFG
jgi:hypothetical protein